HLHILGGEQGPVHPVSFHDTDTSAASLDGTDRDTRFAKSFYISMNGSSGNLKFLRQLRRGSLILLEQYGKNSDQSVYFHGNSFFLLILAQETCQLYGIFH